MRLSTSKTSACLLVQIQPANLLIRLVVLQLRGQLWWGVSVSMLERIKSTLKLEDDGSDSPAANQNSAFPPQKYRRKPLLPSEKTSLLERSMRRSLLAHKRRGGWYLVLDLGRVDGLDASAVRALFLPLSHLAKVDKFRLCFAGLTQAQEQLFIRHGVIFDDDAIASFRTVDEAIEWSQNGQLRLVNPDSNSSRPHSSPAVCTLGAPFPSPPPRLLLPHDDGLLSSSLPVGAPPAKRAIDQNSIEDDCLSLGAARFLVRSVLKIDESHEAVAVSTVRRFCLAERHAKADFLIFDVGEHADAFFCVLTGCVAVTYPSLHLETGLPTQRSSCQLTRTVLPGSFFGFVDGFAPGPQGRPVRTISAVAQRSTAYAAFLFRDLDAIFAQCPEVLVAIQRALLRQSARQLTTS